MIIPTEIVLLVSTARTADVNSADQTNEVDLAKEKPALFSRSLPLFRGIHLVIDVSAIVTAPSVVPTLQGKDDISGLYYTLGTGAAVIAVGTTAVQFYPSLTTGGNLIDGVLPRVWRLFMDHANANSITYSVGAVLLP